MENLGEFIPFLWTGAKATIRVTLMALLFGTPVAFFVGIMRLTKIGWLYWPATVYVEIIRGTPSLLLLFYIFYVLPFMGFRIDPIPAAIFALALNFGGYESEVVRAGFQAVSQPQREAATALNMPPSLAMRRVIFPQAIRIILPPFGNAIIELFKATAIISLVAVQDLTYQGTVLSQRTFETTTVWTLVAMFYFGMAYPSTWIVRWLEKKTAYPS